MVGIVAGERRGGWKGKCSAGRKARRKQWRMAPETAERVMEAARKEEDVKKEEVDAKFKSEDEDDETEGAGYIKKGPE